MVPRKGAPCPFRIPFLSRPNGTWCVPQPSIISWRASIASTYVSCSSAARRAAMPREVWLFTAPRLILIAAAISASDKSA
jgi:hypothetical protein